MSIAAPQIQRERGVSSEDSLILYLASWAEGSDLDVLEHTAGLIDRLARRIEDAALNVP